MSFAYLVYSSSWIKLHEPAAFCAALLNAQPMGFYSPHTLCQDARRHGVTVLGPDLDVSGAAAVLEPCAKSHNGVAVRMGLSSVRKISSDLAETIVAERDANGRFADLADLARRCGLRREQLESLALAGAVPPAKSIPSAKSVPSLKYGGKRLHTSLFPPYLGEKDFGERQDKPNRRRALWEAGAAAQAHPDRLPGIVTGLDAPPLPGMSADEEAVADLAAVGVSPDGHPTRFIRDDLDAMGVVPAAQLAEANNKVLVAGVVTHRQRPATAGGTMFINLEDETGLINVICSKGCWTRYRTVAAGAPALIVRGRLEKVEGVTNVIAETISELALSIGPLRSRNFR